LCRPDSWRANASPSPLILSRWERKISRRFVHSECERTSGPLSQRERDGVREKSLTSTTCNRTSTPSSRPRGTRLRDEGPGDSSGRGPHRHRINDCLLTDIARRCRPGKPPHQAPDPSASVGTKGAVTVRGLPRKSALTYNPHDLACCTYAQSRKLIPLLREDGRVVRWGC
jgi:hypothetical protein